MNYLASVLAGRQPLWHAFWLIGMPAFIAWDLGSGCTLSGACTLPAPMSDLMIVVFGMLTSLVLPLTSLAVWRSATRYRGPRLWTIGAKAWALWWALCSSLFFLIVVYGLAHYAATGRP